MGAIVYLDVDDEITSAAARMRAADEGRVGLVVPYGSRLATSRINFRLLAREAQSRGRQLTIVAPDAATRALAASAGLPVFATVDEYEAALAAPSDEGNGTGSAAVAGAAAGGTNEAIGGKATGGPATGGEATGGEAAEAAVRRGRRSSREDLEQTAIIATPVPPADERGDTSARAREREGGASIPVVRTRRWRPRALVLAAGVLAALVLLVGGVAAYVFLPSAEIRLTPRTETIGPIELDVRADPEATAPDPVAAVVPAERVTFELEAADTFPATGRRVEESKARGRVTFTSENTFIEVTVPRGTRVATESGVAFVTTEQIVIPRASFTTGPARREAPIEAVQAGPGGNVEAGTITEEPSDLGQLLVSVTNPDPTSGGARREFPQVTQADVDGAREQLARRLREQFAARLEDPAAAPPGMTLFPETQTLSEPTPTVDPATLVGREVESFELGMTATGSVIAVDPSPLESLGAERIRDAVEEGSRLVDGSIVVDVGEPAIDGERVAFPVTVRARQVRVVDAEALRERIKGRPVAEARALLEQFGDVELTVWPDWVTAIPTIDQRVQLTVTPGPAGAEPGRPESSGSPTP